MPDTSCNLPGNSDGPSSNAPLFGLAPGGVCRASPVTRRTGALLPHRFTLTLKISPLFKEDAPRRYTFCCTFLHVAVTPRYGAPCPVVFGLSSGPNTWSSDRSFGSGRTISDHAHRMWYEVTPLKGLIPYFFYRLKIRIPKHEIRNNDRMTKIQMTKTNDFMRSPIWLYWF